MYDLETESKVSGKPFTVDQIFRRFALQNDQLLAVTQKGAGDHTAQNVVPSTDTSIFPALPEAGFAFEGHESVGQDYAVARSTHLTFSDCAGLCIQEHRCVTWTLFNGTCLLKNTYVKRKPRVGAWTGYLPLRYEGKQGY